MLSDIELNRFETLESSLSTDETLKLVQEVKRLRQYLFDYNLAISHKIDAVEKNIDLLEAENSRLLSAKRVVYIERDACIGLLCQLARRSGYTAGLASENRVILDLPAGQVSWSVHPEEIHLFSDLPEYTRPIEDLSIEETYRRIMNPDLPKQ